MTEKKKDLKKLLSNFLGYQNDLVQSILEALPKTNDLDQLITWWGKVPSDSKPEKLVEERMTEVLSETNDMDQLINWRRKVFFASKPTKLVKERMTEVLKSILLESVPQWFIKMIKRNEIPDFLLTEFKNKALEICQSL